MTTPTIVQYAFRTPVTTRAQLSAPATPGNTLLGVSFTRDNPQPKPPGTGFTLIDDAEHHLHFDRSITMAYHVVEPDESPYTASGDGVTYIGGGGSSGYSYLIIEIAGEYAGISAKRDNVSSTTNITGGSVTPTAAVDCLIIGGSAGDGAATTTPNASITELIDVLPGGFAPYAWLGYRAITNPSGSYTIGCTQSTNYHCGVTAVFISNSPSVPVADFEADVTGPAIGELVTFTDLSTNTPTSWAWTFGDSGTSTDQNPTHIYAAAGAYTVTLTATNAAGSDSETKTFYINVSSAVVPDPVGPAGALLEIYASDPGSARWDVAKWDEATWGSASWQDVTPQGITVNITWGSNRPELGILSVPEAASWAVDYYDPDRILDPSNADSPYFGDLIPGLPIRVSHRGTVVRQGEVTGISHNFKYPAAGWGYMRGADNITRMANAQVPSDTELADTLVARARDAIAAAGLSISVLPPLGTDPAVSPWLTGTREWSVWEWVRDAAQEVLYIPFIDRLNRLTFRPWDTPLVRARSLASTEMIDLAVVTDYSGLYSVIQARADVDTVIERALTPPPRYGARTYTRDEITIDPGEWAEAVLADRGWPALLWKPGRIRPLTATSTEMLATIEAVERLSILLPEQHPAVIAAGIVVGGEIDIVGKVQDDEGVWRFRYELAQTATEPLIETGGDPTDYLLATGGGEYLYPTGGA